MNNPTPIQAHGPIITRIPDVMSHIPKFASRAGVERLATESGLSAKSVSRLIHGEGNPSFLTVVRLTNALEARLERRVDPRDLIAENGEFLTRFTCDLVGCQGCLPDAATDEFGDLKLAYQGVQPGQWVTSRYPKGFSRKEGGVHVH